MVLFLYILLTALSVVELTRLLFGVKRINSYYVLFYVFVVVTNSGYMALAMSSTISEAILANKICYIGAVMLPVIMLFTISDIAKVRLPKFVYAIMGSLSAITLACVLTIGHSDLYYRSVQLTRLKSVSILEKEYGPMHTVYLIFLIIEFTFFVAITIYAIRKERQVSRETIITLFIEYMVVGLVYALEHLLHARIEYMPFAYVIMGVLHLRIIMKHQIYDISRGISDLREHTRKRGYMAFDQDLRLMNCDDLPIEIFPELGLVQFGSNFYKMTSDFYRTIYLWVNNLTLNFDQKPHEMQFVRDNRVYHCNIVQLTGFRNKFLGFIVEIIDDTENNRKILDLEADNKSLDQAARTDAMTGLLNKSAAEEDVDKAMSPDTHGTFMMLDLDSFKLINDLHGHDAGDKVLIKFADLLREITRPDDIIGRIGGDEFIIYYRGWQTDDSMRRNTAQLNEKLLNYAKELLGEDMTVPLGCSVGAVFIPQCGHEYNEIKKKADKALYYVKQNGKHGISIVNEQDTSLEQSLSDLDTNHLAGVRQSLAERNALPGPLEVGFDTLPPVYRYLARYYDHASTVGGIILFRLEGEFTDEDSEAFWELLQKSLRREDLISQPNKGVFLTILADTQFEDSEVVVSKIFHAWEVIGSGPEVTAEVQNI